MNHRTTPFSASPAWEHEVLVFASNTAGEHGRGASKRAMLYGAVMGEPWGPHGKTFAIPVWEKKRGGFAKPRALADLRYDIQRFIEYATINKNLTFFVTDITYGLSQYAAKAVMQMFLPCVEMQNVFLPKMFWYELRS